MGAIGDGLCGEGLAGSRSAREKDDEALAFADDDVFHGTGRPLVVETAEDDEEDAGEIVWWGL